MIVSYFWKLIRNYLSGLLLQECEDVLGHVSHGRRGELAIGTQVGQVLCLVHGVFLDETVQVVAHQHFRNLEVTLLVQQHQLFYWF